MRLAGDACPSAVRLRLACCQFPLACPTPPLGVGHSFQHCHRKEEQGSALGEGAHDAEPSVSLLKGGIPAAPSGTATLLRLSPSHRFYPKQLLKRSPSSGTPGFHGLTGGVYKVRERIHRAMADARLLAIPTSWSRVADSNPNWDGLSWIGCASRLRDPLYPPL